MNALVSIESNLPQLEQLWQSAPEITLREVKRSMTEALMLLERETIERAPEGRGGSSGLRGGITALEPVASGTSGDVIGLVVGTAAHTVPVEVGTRPHFVPIRPLQDWVEYKLGLEGDEARSVAFAISRTIAKKGTEGKFMFRDAFAQNEQQVEKMLLDAVPRILKGITDEQQ
ncbi:MAG: hypothetical protein P1V33_03495 [Pseudohongiella nitratireducens]|nr:hypothetical protein [Pseudohongiella nitratireducens]MDF1622519.1 hypothetical protein [Pseudohongiella nitratireducens]